MAHDFQAELRRRAVSLLELIDANVPPFLLAQSVSLLWHTATAAFGNHLYEELGRRAMMDARQRAGVCQDCNACINVSLTHPPLCEQCEAKTAKMCDDIDKELRRED